MEQETKGIAQLLVNAQEALKKVNGSYGYDSMTRLLHEDARFIVEVAIKLQNQITTNEKQETTYH